MKKKKLEPIGMMWAGIILGGCLSYLGGVSANLSSKLFTVSLEVEMIIYIIATVGMLVLLIVMLVLAYKSIKSK